MARTATRTANVYTRVDPETKEKAEAILEKLGIPMSNAIGMFLKQVVIQRGIPFEMKLPPEPVSLGALTKEQFDAARSDVLQVSKMVVSLINYLESVPKPH